MTTCLGKSCLFGFLSVFVVNVYLSVRVLSLLVLRMGGAGFIIFIPDHYSFLFIT